jgi:predicted O-methyltransferase YrrM
MAILSLRQKPVWDKKSFYQVEGLKELIKFLKFKKANLSRSLEVGSYCGESASIFLSEPSVKYLYCIDTWDYYPEVTLSSMPFLEKKDLKIVKKIFYENLKEHILSGRCIPIENTSQNAYKTINILFDFIYIDGAHDYDNVLSDLKRWYSKLKVGGFMSGHDYNFDRNSSFYSSTEAIHDFIKSISKYSTIEFHTFKDGSWVFQKQNLI